MSTDHAWLVFNKIVSGGWCIDPCYQREGCGCAAAIADALAAERERCAAIVDQMASNAATANESFVVIGDTENAERHRVRCEAYKSAATVIRARGETPDTTC